jgi:hypothetical protein
MKWENAYALRDDLTPFGAEGVGVFALGLRFGLDDLQTVAAESITDGPDDKKIDVLYIDRAQRSAFIMQCYGAKSRFDQQAPGNKATDLHTAAAYAFSIGLKNVPAQIRAQVADLRSAVCGLRLVTEPLIRYIFGMFITRLKVKTLDRNSSSLR